MNSSYVREHRPEDVGPRREQWRPYTCFFPRTAKRRLGRDVRERRLAKFRQNVARFRLYRLRFLQENMRFAAFFKIYQILKLKFLKFDNVLQILRHLQFFAEISRKLLIFQTDFLRKF